MSVLKYYKIKKNMIKYYCCNKCHNFTDDLTQLSLSFNVAYIYSMAYNKNVPNVCSLKLFYLY